MTLSDLSVKRPVLATVFSLIIILVGLIAFFELPIREYPDIDPPVVTVTTVYPGAKASTVESEITDVIEEELSSIDGIDTVTSTSREQVSSIIIRFRLEESIDIGAQDVRDKISRINSLLPENADEPIIAKADSNSSPIVWVKVQSNKRSLLDLSDFVEKEIKDYFQTIPGVSKVIFGGSRKRSIQILLDPKRLAFHGLTVLDIDDVLNQNNVELPSGRILSFNKEFSINVDSKLTTAKEYANLIVKSEASSVIRLKDVAKILEGPENDRSFVRFNGQKGFGLGIVRQPQANTIAISDEVYETIDQLNNVLPKDIQLSVGYDGAQFIRLSIQEVYKTIIFACILVLIIIFAFIGNLRSTFIPAIAIPISLIGVMGSILAMGFTLNLMTLLGLVIAVGIVVDDSIIVLENIYRYIEEGMDPVEASKKGAREITFAVIATTLVLIAIFLPVGFMSGITGRLLSEFAFSLCFATAISSFVALTMTPMLCSKLLKQKVISGNEAETKKQFKDKVTGFLKSILDLLINSYIGSLNFILKYKYIVLSLTMVSCMALSVYLYQNTPKAFIPDEDRGNFFVIFETPKGSTLSYMDQQIRKAENTLLKIPEIQTVISVAAFGFDAPGKVTQGIMIARLSDWKERSKSVFAIVGPLYNVFSKIPEAFILPIFPKSGPEIGFGAQPIQLVLRSNDVNFLIKASSEITKRAPSLASVEYAFSNLSLNKPEFTVKINKDKASSLGVAIVDIARTLEVLFTGIDLTDFNLEGENYKVIVQIPRDKRMNPKQIGELAVTNDRGDLILLSNLVDITDSVGPEEISHYDRKKSVTIDASPTWGYTPADGLSELEMLAKNIIKELKKPGFGEDVEINYLGTSKELKDADIALYFGFMVALLFAFLFLAGQFESFLSPIIVMLTVPLAITGALIGIAAFQLFSIGTLIAIGVFNAPDWIYYVVPQFENININIYSKIGMIMLIGMASKNGILVVEFINQLRDQGYAVKDAVLEASRLRIRPILMTAFSTILGILPIALALGVGAQSRQSMGVAIIAGMIFATFVSLYIIPCGYMILYGGKDKESKKEQ